MDIKREKIVVDKSVLVAAILELERQDEIQMCLLLDFADRLKALGESLEQTLMADRALCARHTLLNLFLPDSEWIALLTDAQLEEWQAEAKAIIAQHERDFLPPVPDTLCPANNSGAPVDRATPR